MGYKLNFHLIPQTAFGQNMRSTMTQYEWRKLSAFVREPGVCAGCGKYFKPSELDAHEVWVFSHPKQKLHEIVPLCKKCHEATHIGRADATGRLEPALEHIMKVRKWSYRKLLKEYKKAWKRYWELSKCKYKLKTTPEKAWEIAKKNRMQLEAKIAKQMENNED